MRRTASPPVQRVTYSVADIAVAFGVEKDTARGMVRAGWFGDPATFPRTPGGGKLLVPAGPVEAYARTHAAPAPAAVAS